MRHHRIVRRAGAVAVFLLLAILPLASCGSDSGPGAESSGAFAITLAFEPSPPVVGTNALEITVTDGAAPVTGATIEVTGEMPLHGHALDDNIAIVEQGDGHYRVNELRFTMSGEWNLIVNAVTSTGSGRIEQRVTVE